MATTTGRFTVTGGNEQVLHEAPGEVRITRVGGTQDFEGAVEGRGAVEWVFAYRADKTAVFTGIQRIDGLFGGKPGSLALLSTGEHDGRSSRGSWLVIEGSGTGAFAGARGEGSFEAPGGPTVTYELELDFG